MAEQDKTNVLDAKAGDIKMSIDGRQPFSEWQGLHALLRFGGKPARYPLVEPLFFGDDRVALSITELVADHMHGHLLILSTLD